ncbi:hypothetical protein QYE76_005831 [Lolium multiflorum]|uniref:Peptidase A2 domain-containing protein n=1 Tax=Lolium multiflorum TaxID=4521 RepID=A0AAD8W3T9_LOLMU|nr:hypothetical protein QYE76_005831 [Lolium multiflorum]
MVFVLPSEFCAPKDEEVSVAQFDCGPRPVIFEKPRERSYRHLKALYLKGYINGQPISKMLVDTGAAVNIMPYSMLRRLGRSNEDLIKTNVTLSDFNGQPSEAKGVLNVDLTVGRKTIPTSFFIIDSKITYAVLLGRDWIHANCCIPSTMHQCIIQWDGDEVEVVHADDSIDISLAAMNIWEANDQEPLSGINLDGCERIEATRNGSTMVVHMREGQVVRYKVNAKADMVRNNMTLIRCPCRKCGLRQWIDPDSGQLEEHLLRRGFMLGFNEEPAANVGHEEEADIGREDEESPEHGVHHEEGEADEGDDDAGGDGGGDAESKQTPLTSALRDPHVQELLLKDTGNAKPEAKLAQMEVDGMTPLYPGCRPEDTRLSVTLECLEMKAEHKWTDSSFSDNMKSWHARLPKDNTLPTSIDEAKKVVCPLDLPHVKYHACINDCALFRNEYKDRTTCPVCGQGRYKRGNKKVPLKVVWYFPITPRLQRYFVDPKEAKLMQWHAEREKPADDPEKGKILTHPADASQWNALDIEFADEFGSEPRNIRLGMSTDGLNPFGNQSSTHSTWPVFVWPYNLPLAVHKAAGLECGFASITRGENARICSTAKRSSEEPHDRGAAKKYPSFWKIGKSAPRGKKRPRESPLLGVWKARSVFWDLPYWKVLHTPHSLNVMHITKNVTESLLGTLMNMPERTKDGPKARTDLKLLGLKKELQYPTDSDDDDEQTETTQGHHKRAKKNEVVVLKPACFTLSEEELERFFECLLGVKVPHGYSGR